MSHRALSAVRFDPHESAIDQYIWTTAFRLIETHGEAAPIKAAEQALKLLSEGDMEGVVTWRRILRAVRQLSVAPPGGQGH
ncbi:MAG TPA: hypothetical protein VGB82_26930 [Alphaproteobacteria bacterium]